MCKRIRINGVLYEAVSPRSNRSHLMNESVYGDPDWKELHLRTEDGTKVTVSYADYADVYGSYGNLHGKAPFYYVEVVTAKKRGETEWSTSVDSRNLKKLLNELEDIIEDYDYQFDGYRNHLRDYIIDNVTTRLAGTEYTPRYEITDDGVKRVD